MQRLLAVLLSLPAAAGGLPAQTTTLPLDPRATYLRTNNDTPAPPLVVTLASLPAPPGTWLQVGTTGAYRYINGGQDTAYSLIGVFSTNSTVLSTSTAHRVPGAIAAGPDYVTAATFYSSLATDIGEDFLASRNTWGRAMLVEVPVGATHLILGTHDSWYQDNVDPNGDFRAVITVVPQPALPGTGEHLELRTGVGGTTPTALPPERSATAGAAIAAELHQPVGLIDGSLYLLLADVVGTGGPVPAILPRVWGTPTAVVVQVGLVQPGFGWFASWGVTVPPGINGVSLLLQGGALAPDSRNGLYQTTLAHRIALQ